LPLRSRAAAIDVLDGQLHGGVLGVAAREQRLGDDRRRVADFIGAQAEEIVFLRATGDGANLVALGLDWRAGDAVLLCDNEFGANVMPWLPLRERGVELRFIRTPEQRMTPEVLESALDERTRVVAVSWVGFFDGYRHDLTALARVAHGCGALFCVDAIQGLGVFPLDVKAAGIDVLYAGAGKWLLGVQGVSLAFIDAAVLDRIAVRWRGWRDVANIWDFLAYDQPLAAGAARFQGGTPNLVAIAALTSSLEILVDAGLERIAGHVLGLTDALVARLRELEVELLGERGSNVSSGIVSFRVPGRDPVATGRALSRAGFVTTYRPTGIRVSPHGHNDGAQIEAFVEALRALR